MDRNFESLKDVGASVYPDGSVVWLVPVIFHTACRIDAKKFPFDTQHCTMTFGSWAYDKHHLALHTIMDTSQGQYFIENGIWHFKDILVEHIEQEYPG